MDTIKQLASRDFIVYSIIGGIATALDWGIFWLCIHYSIIHYEYALIFSYVLAGLFHYVTNKWFTFQCRSKQIGAQISIYVMVTVSSLLMSMFILFILINYLGCLKMVARILTTACMLFPNYWVHKHLTFSKKI